MWPELEETRVPQEDYKVPRKVKLVFKVITATSKQLASDRSSYHKGSRCLKQQKSPTVCQTHMAMKTKKRSIMNKKHQVKMSYKKITTI